jgi:hypothetical protein
MATTKPTAPKEQLKKVHDSAKRANRDEPRNYKKDALEDKEVRVEPDGTGPTSTGTFDAPEDQRRGSGNPTKGS